MSGIKLFFAGDFCSKPSATNIFVQEELKELISKCDISVINFEVPLKPKNVSLPNVYYERFFQNDDVPLFLRSIGFDLFSIANNHLFDWGIDGYLRTKEEFKEAVFGAGSYDEAYSVKTVEIKGKKIGFLALTYASRKEGVFYDSFSHKGYGCAYLEDLRVNHIIHDKKKELDYLFILPHAGIEYVDAPIPEIIAKYRDFIEWGADAVIASHPHCPQGWEEYQGKPIFYSLGNFYFNSKETVDFVAKRPHWYEGLCVLININDSLSFQVINVKNISNKKIVMDISEERNKHNHYVCQLLQGGELYNNCLEKMLIDVERQVLSTSLIGFLPKSKAKQIRIIIKCLYYVLKSNLSKYKEEFAISLNNIAKREMLRRLLNIKL